MNRSREIRTKLETSQQQNLKLKAKLKQLMMSTTKTTTIEAESRESNHHDEEFASSPMANRFNDQLKRHNDSLNNKIESSLLFLIDNCYYLKIIIKFDKNSCFLLFFFSFNFSIILITLVLDIIY